MKTGAGKKSNTSMANGQKVQKEKKIDEKTAGYSNPIFFNNS